MKSATRISFIRHGMVENPLGIIYGRLSRFRLSQEGVADAQSAGKALRDTPLAAVYSSPLLRARQTAQEVLRHHPNLRLHISSLITEVKTPFEGKPESSLAAVKGDVYADKNSSGEQPAEILVRTKRFIERVRKNHPDSHIAAVSHGDVILFLLLHAAGYAPSAENKTHLARLSRISEYPATGSITTFTYHDKDTGIPNYTYRRSQNTPAINKASLMTKEQRHHLKE